jgi:hypothetical protein
MKWLQGRPYMSQAMDLNGQSVMVLMCLGIGLVLRDLHAVQFEFGEEGLEADESVQHVQASRLGWGQSQSLLRECRRLKIDILLCCGMEADQQTPPPEDVKPKSARRSSRRGPQSKANAAATM